MTSNDHDESAVPIFSGPGEARASCRSVRWGATRLGPVERWSPSLRAAVQICLESPAAMALWVGPGLTLIHNDAYGRALGARSLTAMGGAAREVWSTDWGELGPAVEQVLREGRATGGAHSLTAVRDEGGRIAALLHVIPDAAPEGADGADGAEPDAISGAHAHHAARVASYRALFESMDEGFCVVQGICGGAGRVVDCRILEVNAAFERYTGLANARGRAVRELIPDVESYWFDVLDDIMRGGPPRHVESYHADMRIWLDVYACRIGAPAERTVALLFNDITPRKHADAVLRATRERQAFLLELEDALRSLTDPEEVVFIAAQMLAEELAVDRAGYSDVVVEDGVEYFRIHRGYRRLGTSSVMGMHPVASYGPAVLDAMRTGQTLVVTNVDADARFTPEERVAYRAVDVRAFINTPLLKDSRTAATFGVHQTTPRTWTSHEVALVEGTAARTRAAVERARAEERLRESEARQVFLLKLGDAIRWLTDAAEIEGTATRRLGEYLGAAWSSYCTVDEDTGVVLVRSGYAADGARSLAGQYRMNDLWLTSERTTCVVTDVATDPRMSPSFRDHVLALSIRAFVTAPLVKNGRLLAFLCVSHDAEREWRPQEVALIEEVAERTWEALERARTEEALRVALAAAELERSRLSAVLEALPAGVAIAEPDGEITLYNAAFTRLWGGAPVPKGIGEHSGWRGRWADTGAPIAPEDWAMARALRTGEAIAGDIVEIDRLDGSGTVTTLNAAAPIRSADGRLIGGVVAAVDITAQKQAEQALQVAHARLLEVDQRKNEFIAVLSHELRNPLAPIKNSLYVLERAAPGSEQARQAQAVIERQVNQLARLVDDLLDVTRISSNKVQLQRQRLELNELVRRTLEDHRSLFAQNEVAVELAPAPEPVFVHADWSRIAQVVGNLLVNAAKFTGPGGQVRVSVAQDRAAGQAVLRVADTGVGISPDMLARLFQPFMQADTTLDRSKGGLGLGLALVKGLVDLHGGEIAATSAGLGLGAELVVRLPLDAAGAARPPPGGAAEAAHARRILIIEDNQDAADCLRLVLELDRHEVDVAYNGPEGVARALAFRPDVVLCDIGLPGMDGYAVARAFKANDRLKDCFLVALSGYARREDLERAADAGFARHLAKPASTEALAKLIAAVPRGDG